MQRIVFRILLLLLTVFDSTVLSRLFPNMKQRVQHLPSFGSDAAGPACDGAVNVREVGVIPRVVSRTNLQVKNQKGLCGQGCLESSGGSQSVHPYD